MHARLTRIIDWVFEADRASDTQPTNVATPARIVPRREDRGRYDSGTAFFGC